jgi:hypothetical protein
MDEADRRDLARLDHDAREVIDGSGLVVVRHLRKLMLERVNHIP